MNVKKIIVGCTCGAFLFTGCFGMNYKKRAHYKNWIYYKNDRILRMSFDDLKKKHSKKSHVYEDWIYYKKNRILRMSFDNLKKKYSKKSHVVDETNVYMPPISLSTNPSIVPAQEIIKREVEPHDHPDKPAQQINDIKKNDSSKVTFSQRKYKFFFPSLSKEERGRLNTSSEPKPALRNSPEEGPLQEAQNITDTLNN